MDVSFRIPGTVAPEIVVQRPFFGNLRVLVDGVPAKRVSRRRLEYDIPLPDGTATRMRLDGQWRGLQARIGDAVIPLERRLSVGEMILTILPFGLVAVGGLIGGLYGGIGAAVNARLARRLRPPLLRVGAMIGVALLAAALWFATAVAIAPVPTLTVGTCLNAIRPGGTVTSNRGVDCGSPHDNEVVGTVRHAGDGAYPGQDALLAEGQVPCASAFGAYVGRDFQSSSLEMVIVVPSDITWAKGDRTIACVALTGDGSKLTGSIRNSGR